VRARRSLKAKLIEGEGPLAKVPPFAAFLLVAAVFVVAVLVGGAVGALLLGVLAAGLALLLAVTWQALSSSERAGRVFILAVLVAVAVSVLLTK
jgi:thiol:disulfide interchange protein